jgi:hypothetical protein
MDAVFVHSFGNPVQADWKWSNLSKEVASLVDQPIEATLGETQTGP